jgi:hypothetical protein
MSSDKKNQPEIKPKYVLVFEFDKTLFPIHSHGHPTKNFTPTDENITQINTFFSTWLKNGHTIIILTRSIQSETIQWCKTLLEQKKITFAVSATNEPNTVRIISPKDLLYKAHLQDDNYWPIWKADQMLFLQDEYKSQQMFYIDYLESTLQAVKLLNPSVNCIEVPEGDYMYALTKVNEWLDTLDKQGKKKRKTKKIKKSKSKKSKNKRKYMW